MRSGVKNLIKNRPRLSKLINALAYEPTQNVFLLTDERIGFAFACSPLAGSSGDEGDRLKAGLTVDWPDDTAVQFTLVCTENINNMKTGYLRLRRAFEESGRTEVDENTQRLMQKVTQARANYFLERTTKPVDSISGVKIREQNLIISVTVPISSSIPTSQEVVNAKELAHGLQTSLDSCGLAPVPLSNDLYRELLASILNQGQSASWRTDPFM